MFTRLAHVCLQVQSLEKSIEFYSRLGFKVIFKFTRKEALYGAYLEIAPNNYVEMFQNDDIKGKSVGRVSHFCLETDNIDAVIEALQEKGISHTPKKKGCDDTYQIWLTDPDGNDFEVHQYTATSRQKIGGDVEADW